MANDAFCIYNRLAETKTTTDIVNSPCPDTLITPLHFVIFDCFCVCSISVVFRQLFKLMSKIVFFITI